MKTILIYDGSFAGFLTAVYQVFDENLKEVCVVKPKHYAPEMFAEGKIVTTSNLKAKKVWHSLQLKVSKHAANELYKVFLSEIKGTEDALLRYIIYAYSAEFFSHTDYSNVYALRVHQVAKMVDREVQRLKDTTVFDNSKTDVNVAVVNSSFDVLPLLGKYFSKTLMDKKWVVYDKKRNYGLFYDLQRLTQIELDQLQHVQELHSLELGNSDTPLHMKSQSELYHNRISADC
ncbi:TIGR03915 family putative DNA repair protein [Galbibacter sp.]|uniref:TIGR03915 family putative DNA repair protein n=1 Tax=Galbibacter sp. TaxID=2918471 RepID=UPI003A946F02